MDAFEQFVTLAMESGALAKSSPLKFELRRKTRYKRHIHPQR